MSADFAHELTAHDYGPTPEDSLHRTLDRALAKPAPAETPGPDGDGVAAGVGGGEALSLLLRQTARAYLGLKDGDYWPSDVADAQAKALLASDWLAAHVAAARAEALREAADRWTQGAWSDVMLPKPTPPAVPVIAYSNRVGDWLRARAEAETP